MRTVGTVFKALTVPPFEDGGAAHVEVRFGFSQGHTALVVVNVFSGLRCGDDNHDNDSAGDYFVLCHTGRPAHFDRTDISPECLPSEALRINARLIATGHSTHLKHDRLIENQFHWRLDAVMSEDESRIQCEKAAENLASI